MSTGAGRQGGAPRPGPRTAVGVGLGLGAGLGLGLSVVGGVECVSLASVSPLMQNAYALCARVEAVELFKMYDDSFAPHLRD